MMLWKLIKGGIDNFYIWPYNGFFDVSYFLRTLIDQKNDQMHVRIVSQNRLCHIFQQSCLTGFRRRYDHSSLSFTDRADQIYDPHGNCAARSFHYQSLIWKNRCHIFKIISSLSLTRWKTIDGIHIKKGTEFLSLCFNTDASFQDITGFQIEPAYLRR